MFNYPTALLQATLVSASSGLSPDTHPHHPITCADSIRLCEDGSMSCDHASTGAADPRVQAALNHSMAILIIELATKL